MALFILVVNQVYETRVGDEFVMLGNDAFVKCQIPSFVSDNILVEGWITSEGIEVAQSLKNIGKIKNHLATWHFGNFYTCQF